MNPGRTFVLILLLFSLALLSVACGVNEFNEEFNYDYYNYPGSEAQDSIGEPELDEDDNCENNVTKVEDTTFVLLGGATLTEVPNSADETKAYTLKPGNEDCGTDFAKGMLVQPSKSIKNITFLLNGAEISLGSTVFLTAPQPNQLAVNTLEGSARVTVGGKTATSVAGTKLSIPVDDSFQVVGEPSELEAVEVYEDDFLPIDLLEYEFEYADPLDEDELNFFNEYEVLFDEIEVEDVDELFEYMSEQDGEDIVGYLVGELEYTYFDDDLEEYFQDDLGYDLDEYEGYTGEEFIEEDGEYVEDEFIDDTCDPEFEECDDVPIEDDSGSGNNGGD